MSLNFQAEESNPLGYGCFVFFFFLVYGNLKMQFNCSDDGEVSLTLENICVDVFVVPVISQHMSHSQN